jgi:hypothetical protein
MEVVNVTGFSAGSVQGMVEEGVIVLVVVLVAAGVVKADPAPIHSNTSSSSTFFHSWAHSSVE